MLKATLFKCVLFILLLAVGCTPSQVNIGELHKESKHIDLDAATNVVQVELSMDAGEIKVANGSTDGLADAEFTYNIEEWRPEVTYENGKLIVLQGALKDKVYTSNDTHNRWDIQLNNRVPIDLVVDISAGQLDLDLAQLMLQEANIRAEAADIDVNLNGSWEHDVSVDIGMGVGDCTLHLPSGMGVRVKIDGAVKNVSALGFDKYEDAYINDVFGSTNSEILINIKAGVGDIILELDQ